MKPIPIRNVLIMSTLVFLTNASAQMNDTSYYIQYPAKGYMLLNSGEKIFIKGLNYWNTDSIILFEKGSPIAGIKVYKNLSLYNDVHPHAVSITNIRMLKENRHATTKGMVTGALVGFGLGYIAGYATYQDKAGRTVDENIDSKKTRAGFYGLIGTIPVGLTGALIGSVLLKKRFMIEGNKEKLAHALSSIY